MLTPKLPLMAAAWRSGCLQKSWIGHDVPVISWTCWRATIRIQARYPNVFSATCAVHANVCGYVHMQHMLVMRSRVRHPWELSERLGLHFSFSVGPWCVFQTFLGFLSSLVEDEEEEEGVEELTQITEDLWGGSGGGGPSWTVISRSRFQSI